ncbi:hypothetical protein ACFDTO_37370 [Microbacteriaceae bacterium 4G12]
MKLNNWYKIYKSPLLYILIFALAIHMYFIVKDPGSVFHEPETFGKEVSIYGSLDASKYSKMAWQLLHDGIYGYAEAKPNAFVTPGQPFYLAAIFQVSEWIHVDHVLLAKLVNMLLDLGIIALIYAISQLLFRNVYIASISSFLYATYFSSYHFFRTTLTEIPSMFFFMLSIFIFLLLLKKDSFRLHTLFGVIAAITLMFRPTPAPLLLIAWGIIIYKHGLKKAIKIGLIWCIGPVVIMGPWVIRNLLVFGHAYLFSSHAGDPLLSGANPFYMYDEDKMQQSMLHAGYSLTSEDKARYARYLIKDGFTNNFALWFSWFTVGKTISLFTGPDGTYLYWNYFKPWVMEAFKNQHLFVVITALLGTITLRKNKKVVLFSMIIWGYIALSNIFLVILRYGFFIIPCICIISGCFLVYSSESIYRALQKVRSIVVKKA